MVIYASLISPWRSNTGTARLYDSAGKLYAETKGVQLSIVRDPDDVVWDDTGEVRSATRGDGDFEFKMPRE